MTFSFQELFSDIRHFIYGGITSMPLMIAGTLLILGLLTGNYAMLFFLVGFLIVVPLISTISNLGLEALFDILKIPEHFYKVPSSEFCNIIYNLKTTNSLSSYVDGGKVCVVPSLWMTMITFFFSYILINAVLLYTLPSQNEDGTDDNKKSLRRSQAMISIISIVVVALSVILLRVMRSGCETWLGILFSLLIGGGTAYAWITFMTMTGNLRLADLFGIANRILTPESSKNEAVACLPVG
jgi:hypothetical protein